MRTLGRFLFKLMMALGLAVVVMALVGIGFAYRHYAQMVPLPDARQLVATSAVTGLCPAEDERRQFVALADVPPLTRAAFLVWEPDFFVRSPINPFLELARAAWLNQSPRGSVITNGVVRCLMSGLRLPQGDMHIGGGVLFWRIERTLPREVVFEIYLNELWLGRRIQGVAAAAQGYFGKRLADLTVDEAAYLAALHRAPSAFGRKLERDTEHRNLVIDRIQASGVISPAQARAAKDRPVILQDASASN